MTGGDKWLKVLSSVASVFFSKTSIKERALDSVVTQKSHVLLVSRLF